MVLKLEGKKSISTSVSIYISTYIFPSTAVHFLPLYNYDKEGSTTFHLKSVFVRIFEEKISWLWSIKCPFIFSTVLMRH